MALGPLGDGATPNASASPSRSTKKLEYAEFTCRFDNDKVGVRKELLDYVNEIVIPAFFNDSFIREVRGGDYYLLNVSLVEVDRRPDPVIGIVGRFVKDTRLKIEQRVEMQNDEETQAKERIVVADGREFDRALSSVFLLVLNDHSLVYLHETQDAPGVEAFGNTMQVFFNRQRQIMLRRLFAENEQARKSGGEFLTLEGVREQNPLAKVHVTPLLSRRGIESAVEDFRIVQQVSFTSHRTNSSTVKDFTRVYRETQTQVASTAAFSSFYNTDGLEKQQVQELVTEVAGDTSTDIRLLGQDYDGGQITRSRGEIKVKEDYPNETATLENLAPTGGHFWDYIKRAFTRDLFVKRTVQQNPAEVKKKMEEVAQRHSGEIRRV